MRDRLIARQYNDSMMHTPWILFVEAHYSPHRLVLFANFRNILLNLRDTS
jgi:hypothetical protein